jgi:hypothetical protein
MISIRKVTTAATAFSVALAVCASGVASAQTSPTEPAGMKQDSQSPTTKKTDKESSQETMDREKVTLKDRAKEQLDSADANIDQLRKLSSNATGPTKKQHDDMARKLTDSRDRLKKDLDKLDSATVNDWHSVRPSVEHDVSALNTQLQRASAVTNVPLPKTGVTNKQPTKQPQTP